MSEPPKFDSTQLYKIINLGWPNKQAADLLLGDKTGYVAGYHDNNDSKNQSWAIEGTPDATAFKNGTTGTYAHAYIEREDVALTGNEQEYKWHLFGVSPHIFEIRTVDDKYLWVLESGEDETPIVLKPIQSRPWGREAQWTIAIVGA